MEGMLRKIADVFQEDPGPERLAVFDDTLPNCVILPQAHPRNRAQDTTGLL